MYFHLSGYDMNPNNIHAKDEDEFRYVFMTSLDESTGQLVWMKMKIIAFISQ